MITIPTVAGVGVFYAPLPISFLFSFPPLLPESYHPGEPFRSSLLYSYLECTAKCVLFFPSLLFFEQPKEFGVSNKNGLTSRWNREHCFSPNRDLDPPVSCRFHVKDGVM